MPGLNGRPKTALVLGAGGLKGWAHVGALKVLHEASVPIDLIVGASAGALIGPLYAAEKDAVQMERIAGGATPLGLLEWLCGGLRISDKGGSFSRSLWQSYGRLSFDELAIPFAAVSLDISSGKPVALRSGSVASAVEASIRPPVLMSPISVEGGYLVDGGIHNTVPIAVAHALGAERVIAVSVGEFFQLPPSLRPLSARTASVFRRREGQPHDLRGQVAFMAGLLARGRAQRPQPDVLIRPNLRGFRSFVPIQMRERVRRGEIAARRALPAIRATLNCG